MRIGHSYQDAGSSRRASFKLMKPNANPRLVSLANVCGSLLQSEFSDFSPEKYGELTQVPKATKDYYLQQAAEGKRPLLFYGCPHVLVKGNVNVQGCEILNWA